MNHRHGVSYELMLAEVCDIAVFNNDLIVLKIVVKELLAHTEGSSCTHDF